VPRTLLIASLTLLVALTGCDDTPTSVLLEIRAAEGLLSPEILRLDIYGGDGRQLQGYRVPPEGTPQLPDTVVLYPPQSRGRLVVVGRAFVGDGVVGEGAVQLALEAGTQLKATLELAPGRLPDADGDGVPDPADRCPGQPDPPQGPCARDGGAEAAVDGGLDAGDGPRPDGPMPDGQTDSQTDGPQPDQGVDTRADAPGPDGPPLCTKPSDCDDGDPCTENVCTASGCTNPAIVCPQSGDPCRPNVCKQPGGCAPETLPDGDVCDDKDPCTQGETCQSGSCTAPPKLVEQVTARDISFRGDRAVVIDSKGAIHAVLYEWQQQTLHHATKASATAAWQLTTIHKGSDVGSYPSLAIDANDKLYAFYQVGDGASAMMHLATKTSTGNWTHSPLVQGDGHSAIAVDGGTVHLAYQRSYDLYHATVPPSSPVAPATKVWDGSITNQAVQISMVVGGGKVHLAYGVGIFGSAFWEPRSLRYAVKSGNSWSTEAVWSSAGINHGSTPSIALASGGAPWISFGANFSGASGGGLYLGRRASTGSWSVAKLDGDGVGSFSTLFIDQGGDAQIVYRDFHLDRLLFGKGSTSSNWKTQVLDTTGQAGRWASAAQHPSGQIHVVYEDSLNDIVRYARINACP
jgi:hypothetical protein